MNAQSLIGSTLGKYQIQAEIGRGGMAAVYKGYDAALERHVAVKVLASFLVWQEAPIERFLREARSAAQLGHPNIVTILDVGEERGWYYYVMEYLEGRTLTQILRQQGAQPADRTVSILQPLAEALDYAHEKGVVHRDVKSSNIVVGRAGRVTLTDFGIARAAQETRLTATGMAIGTPEYMSPEQAEGQVVDARSDQYSLAVVAYEMLSGQVPFQAENTLALLLKVTREPPPPIRAARPDLAPQVEQVLVRALAKDPDDRYRSVRGFMAALGKALAIKGPVPRRPVIPAQPPEEMPTVVRRQEDTPAPKPAAGGAATAAQARKPLWRRVPAWLWALAGVTLLVMALGGLLLGLGGGDGDRMATPGFTAVVATEPNEGGAVAVAAPATATLRPTTTAEPEAAAPMPAESTATPPASPVPTRTKVPSPRPTRTRAPTDTRAPTTAPSPTPTPSRTSAPTPTRVVPPTKQPPSPTAKPATAANRYPAPSLLAPPDGQEFAYRDQVVLTWEPAGQLPADAYYEVVVAYMPATAPGETWYDETPWTKEVYWVLSEHSYLSALSADSRFQWSVRVMRKTGQNAQGRPTGTELSPTSATRTLIWLAPPGGDRGEGDGGRATSPPP